MPDAIVAGHICLDVIPSFDNEAAGIDQLLVPGALVSVGPAVTSTGGAVSNTGIALHRLGTSVGLVGKVGDDLFGRAVLDHLRGYSERLAEGVRAVASEVLGIAPDSLPMDRPLGNSGLDSLMAMELRNRLEQALDRAVGRRAFPVDGVGDLVDGQGRLGVDDGLEAGPVEL